MLKPTVICGVLCLWTGGWPCLAQAPIPEDCTEAKQRLERAEARLRDWPNLARYADANRQLPAAGAGEERVVFMGDSITDLWDDEGFGGFFPGKPYVNRGISGQTTPQY
jgi:hypothetical protein